MSAVSTALFIAKRWRAIVQQKKPPAVITDEASMNALFELSMEPARQRVVEELTWQMFSLEPLSLASLAGLGADVREALLGDRLFRLVGLVEKTRAPKVTGMLLELDDYDLLEILAPRDPYVGAETLCRWVGEAQGVLREAWLANPPPPPPNSACSVDKFEYEEPAAQLALAEGEGSWKVVTSRRRGKKVKHGELPPAPKAAGLRARPRFSHDELELKLTARGITCM